MVIDFSTRIPYSVPEYRTAFWNAAKFATGICKSWMNLVLKLWISEFVLKESLFLTTNKSKENMYWDWRGRIPNF